MKIIAKAGHGNYIAEVSDREIQKFFNTYYSTGAKEINVEVGKEFDLGEGHDFMRDINMALRKSHEFMESNAKIVETVLRGVTLFSSFGRTDEPAEEEEKQTA